MAIFLPISHVQTFEGGLFSYGGDYFPFFTENRPQKHKKHAILHTSQANGGGSSPPRPPLATLLVAFTRDGRQDEEFDTQIGKANAVMRALHYSVVMKRELSKKEKLSIFKAVFFPILTYGHESWVMTERMRSQVHASEMRFLRRIEGVTLFNKVHSSEIQKSLNMEQFSLDGLAM